jgi:DNA-binding transcriptional LysR family regulator
MGAIEGPLRLHVPSCLGEKHVHPIVIAFQDLHPRVSVDLVLESRNVDLVHENFDIAIKYGRPEGQELVIRRLGFIRRVLAASPDFLARVGPIDTLARLADVDMITTHVVAPRDVLTLQHGGRTVDVTVRPVLRTNNAAVISQTLLSGRAAGPVQHLLVADELAAGKLVRILPDYDVKPTEAFLAYPSVRFMRPVVRAFTDFMISALRAVDGIDATERAAPVLEPAHA